MTPARHSAGMALTVGELQARFTGDASDYFRTAKQVRQDAKRTERDLNVTGKVDADITPLTRSLARAKAAVAAASRDEAVITIDADIKKAQARIKELEGKRGATTIDVDAEISKAQARIRTLESKRNAINLAVDVDRAKAQVEARKAGEAANEAAGDGFQRSRGVDRASEAVARRNNAKFSALIAAGMFAGVPAAAAVAGTAAVAALGVVPAAFIAIGAAASATRDDVASEWRALGSEIVMLSKDAASPMVDEFVEAGAQLRGTVQDLSPQVRAAFAYAAEGIDPLVDGIDTAARVSMPGLIVAAQQSGPVMRGVGELATQMGLGVREMFFNLAEGADGAGRVLNTTGGIVRDFLGFTGELLANLSTHGGPVLEQFRGSLQQVESVILTLTSTGMPLLSGATSGFLSVVGGGIGLLDGFISAIGGWAGPIAATAGALKAVNMVTFGGLTSQFRGLRAQISQAEGASSKFGTAVGGLLRGALHPATLATAGFGLILAELGREQQQAARRAAELKQAQGEYAEVLAANGGVIDEQVSKLSQQRLAADGSRIAADALGVSWSTVSAAALGNEAALTTLNAQLSAAETEAATSGETINVLGMTMSTAGLHAATLAGAVEQERSALEAARREQELANEAALNAGDSILTLTDAQEGAATSAQNLEGAFGVLADTAADVEEKGRAIIDILAELSGRTPSAEEAVQSVHDAVREMSEAMEDGVDKTKGWSEELLNADGTINTITANGSELQDFLTGAAEDMATAAKSWSQSGVSVDEVTKRLGPLRDQVAAVAKEYGLNDQQVRKLLESYGLMPEKVAVSAELTGNALTQTQLILSELERLPDNKPVHVDALTDDAKRALFEMGLQIVELPNGEFEVFADTKEGHAAARALAESVDGRVLTAVADLNTGPGEQKRSWFEDAINATSGTVTMYGDTRPGNQSRGWLVDAINRSFGTAGIRGNNNPGFTALRNLLGSANRSSSSPRLGLATGPAFAALYDFERRAAATVFKQISVSVSSVWGNAAGGVWAGGRPVGFADGGIAEQVAAGQFGAIDANRAAIAQPNSLKAVIPFIGDRTHDREFYIPDNRDSRTLRILQEANRSILGTPHPAGMASGGILGAARQILQRIQSGQFIFEDLTWRGADPVVGQYNDRLMDMLGASGTGWYREDVAAALQRFIANNTPRPSAVRTAAPASAPSASSPSNSVINAAVLHELRSQTRSIVGAIDRAAAAGSTIVLRVNDRELATAVARGTLLNGRR